jgi:DNA polymerase III alpha subunit (gram-positive type)
VIIAFKDHETSGLDPATGESIELFVKIWDSAGGPSHGRTWHRLWMPQGEVSLGAAKVNGFTREAWAARGARPLEPSDMFDLDAFLAESGATMFGGAATQFDVGFTKQQFRRARVEPHYMNKMSHRQVDVQSLGIPFVLAGKVRSVSLADLCKLFGVVNSAAHSAQGDVEATIAVFEREVAALWGSVTAFQAVACGGA